MIPKFIEGTIYHTALNPEEENWNFVSVVAFVFKWRIMYKRGKSPNLGINLTYLHKHEQSCRVPSWNNLVHTFLIYNCS